jgi:hypothetical protein
VTGDYYNVRGKYNDEPAPVGSILYGMMTDAVKRFVA